MLCLPPHPPRQRAGRRLTPGIPLRIAEPTGRYRRFLRRYVSFRNAPAPNCWHDSSAQIGEFDELDRIKTAADDWPHDDSRWPRQCERCNVYEFSPSDEWQRKDAQVYRLADGSTFAFRRSLGRCAPPGTMIRADWYDEYAGQPGESWLIALPDGGDWITTQRASGGGYWTVTGTAPAITVSPSIWHNQPSGWHGWIRDGVLEDA